MGGACCELFKLGVVKAGERVSLFPRYEGTLQRLVVFLDRHNLQYAALSIIEIVFKLAISEDNA